MTWILLVLAVALWAWGAWPRRVAGGQGHGADRGEYRAPAESGAPVRVATFNIHGGKGDDGRRDLSRTAGALTGVDIAALQEIHNTWRLPRQHDDIATRLGLAALYAPCRSRWFRRHRGNALLSRYPVGEWTRLPLDYQPGQGYHFRNVTITRVELSRPTWVLFTHLNRNRGNEAQLEQVMSEFLKRSPAVLMGDFNMKRDHPALRSYLSRDDVADALGDTLGDTLDDDSPDRIDWILCRGMTPLRGGVMDNGASDHPLYWCDLVLDPE